MPQTPLLVFQVTIAALVALAVKNGIEVLARTAEVVFLIIPIAIMIILQGNIPNMRFNQLLPLLSDGAAPVARGVLTHWPWFGEIVVWTLLFPFFQQNKQCRRALNLSVPIAGLTLLGVTVSVLAAFTPYRAPAMRYPLFQLAAFVVGGEFRGMESFFLLFLSQGKAGHCSCVRERTPSFLFSKEYAYLRRTSLRHRLKAGAIGGHYVPGRREGHALKGGESYL
ncbi:MAG: spore germination protein [Bacillota bacterium]|nr:spore germination protein [Bacillota bacterium]